MLCAIKAAFEIRVDNPFKGFFLHAQDQRVIGNTRIVDQHVNGSKLSDHLVHHLFDRCVICHVALADHGTYAEGFAFFFNGSGLFSVSVVVDGYVIAFLCQIQSNGSADSPAGTGDQCCFIFHFYLLI